MKYSNINTKMRYSAPYGTVCPGPEYKSGTAPARFKVMHARAEPTAAERKKRANELLRKIAALDL